MLLHLHCLPMLCKRVTPLALFTDAVQEGGYMAYYLPESVSCILSYIIYFMCTLLVKGKLNLKRKPKLTADKFF